MNEKKLSKRIWFNLILFGFMGQIAWSVENVYFNTFLFNSIGGSTRDISLMVSLSAVTAVLATFIMGTLSDKIGKRKAFISGGYIVWGLTVAAFALINRENTAELFKISDTAKILALTVSIVIVTDCLMTFIGSTSNDAAFNAWITDVTSTENRGVAEGVLSTLPILSMLFVTVAFGAGVTAVGYPMCFIGLGAIVTLCGLLGLATLKDPPMQKKKETNYLKELFYGFKPSVVKENSTLYLSLAAVCIFSIAVQIFMPYIFIYIQHFLHFDFNSLAANLSPLKIAIAALVLVGFVALIVLMGKLLDKVGKAKFIYPSIIVFVVGLFVVSRARSIGVFAALALIMLCGYGLLMIILNASVRDFTPPGKAGLFQGIRMIFYVLLPMVIGPSIGSFVCERFAPGYDISTYINEYGESVYIPVPEMFIASGVVAVFIFLPILFARKKIK